MDELDLDAIRGVIGSSDLGMTRVTARLLVAEVERLRTAVDRAIELLTPYDAGTRGQDLALGVLREARSDGSRL